MNAIDVVKAGLSAVEMGAYDKFSNLLSDDMVFAGPVPQPIGKDQFVGLQQALTMAMSDWKFNASDFKESGDMVMVNLRITGTHTGNLTLPMPGMENIPATGKRVSLPIDPTTFTVKNGKIARIETKGSPTTGVAGILSQLGISMPTM